MIFVDDLILGFRYRILSQDGIPYISVTEPIFKARRTHEFLNMVMNLSCDLVVPLSNIRCLGLQSLLCNIQHSSKKTDYMWHSNCYNNTYRVQHN